MTTLHADPGDIETRKADPSPTVQAVKAAIMGTGPSGPISPSRPVNARPAPSCHNIPPVTTCEGKRSFLGWIKSENKGSLYSWKLCEMCDDFEYEKNRARGMGFEVTRTLCSYHYKQKLDTLIPDGAPMGNPF